MKLFCQKTRNVNVQSDRRFWQRFVDNGRGDLEGEPARNQIDFYTCFRHSESTRPAIAFCFRRSNNAPWPIDSKLRVTET